MKALWHERRDLLYNFTSSENLVVAYSVKNPFSFENMVDYMENLESLIKNNIPFSDFAGNTGVTAIAM